MRADLDLVQDAKAGSRQAFAELVGRHQKSMLRLALRITRQWELAEDIVQESFMKAYRGLGSFGERASFKSWLYQITLNTARNRMRGRSHDMVSLDLVQLGTAPTVDAHIQYRSVQTLVQEEVDRLPERQRIAITLRIYEDLSFKEIADIMECPYDTAKANYRHGLLKLKDRFKIMMSNNPILNRDGDVWIDSMAKTAEVE